MTTPTLKIYPSTLLKNNDSEHRLENKLNDAKSSINSIDNNKEFSTYFKKNHEAKMKYKIIKHSHQC